MVPGDRHAPLGLAMTWSSAALPSFAAKILTQRKGSGFCVYLVKNYAFLYSPFFGAGDRTRTHLDADAQWASARPRLDGDDTIVQSSPVTQVSEGAVKKPE